MRRAFLLVIWLASACSGNDELPTVSEGFASPEATPGVGVRCFVQERDCTRSYQLAMEAVDPRFAPGVVRASVRATEVRLCSEGDPRYDVELTDHDGQSIEITVAMRGGELVACTY
jgi:hypothetical protein